MVKITINGQTLEVPAHMTVLKAAEQAGIVIPTLCYHRDLSPYGGCRLCVVEIQGARLPATSCTMPVSNGMVVQTESPKLTEYRRGILELLLYNYYDAGYTRNNGESGLALDTQFAYWVQYYGIDIRKAMAPRPRFPVDSDPNPYVWVDKNKCILCLRCVRACAEIQGRFVWSQAFRGADTRIVAGAASTMLQSRCESDGACVAVCPTGALDNKMSITAGKADRLVTTTCSYCGVGCQFDLNVKDDVPGGRVIRVTSTPHTAVNRAVVNGIHLCVKGRYGYDFIHSPQRIRKPLVRQHLLEGQSRPKQRSPWVEVDWDTALDLAARGLQQAREQYGPQGVGIIASGRLLNEENYLLNKLARHVLRTNNIDCGSHLAHASTVDGLEQVFGLPAMPSTLDDLVTHAQSMLVIGSNTSEQHPVLSAHIRQAVLRWGVKLVVAHPDFVNIAEYATLRLVHRPGSDLALINGLAHLIIQNGWEDRDFIARRTQGYPAYRESLAAYPPEKVAAETGVPIADLHRAAEILARNRPMAILWSVDLVRFTPGPQNVLALVNLGLLLGNLDVPGGGLFPLRSQNNAQGANDMGCRPGFYPGYQPASDLGVREKFALGWGLASSDELPQEPGMTAAQMFAAAEAGRLHALYVAGDDLVSAALDPKRVRRGLQSCDLVILQECLRSQTDPYADILLPGVTFAEKSGTFTNTERRIQAVEQAISPQGLAWPDWQIICALARRLLKQDGVESNAFSGWDYGDTAQILKEIALLTPIYAGVSQARLQTAGYLQWPIEGPDHPGTPTLALNQTFQFIPQ